MKRRKIVSRPAPTFVVHYEYGDAGRAQADYPHFGKSADEAIASLRTFIGQHTPRLLPTLTILAVNGKRV